MRLCPVQALPLDDRSSFERSAPCGHSVEDSTATLISHSFTRLSVLVNDEVAATATRQSRHSAQHASYTVGLVQTQLLVEVHSTHHPAMLSGGSHHSYIPPPLLPLTTSTSTASFFIVAELSVAFPPTLLPTLILFLSPSSCPCVSFGLPSLLPSSLTGGSIMMRRSVFLSLLLSVALCVLLCLSLVVVVSGQMDYNYCLCPGGCANAPGDSGQSFIYYCLANTDPQACNLSGTNGTCGVSSCFNTCFKACAICYGGNSYAKCSDTGLCKCQLNLDTCLTDIPGPIPSNNKRCLGPT